MTFIWNVGYSYLKCMITDGDSELFSSKTRKMKYLLYALCWRYCLQEKVKGCLKSSDKIFLNIW